MMQNNVGNGEYNDYSMEFAVSNQELVTNKRKRSKTLLIFTVVIIIVLISILSFALYQHIYHLPIPQPHKRHSQITLDGVLDGTFEPRRFNGTWVSDNEIMMKSANVQVVLYNVQTDQHKILLQDQTGFDSVHGVELSADRKYLLIAHSVQKVYRHSFYAHYTIVNIETQKRIPITRPNGEPLQFAKWSTVGNGYAYIHRNDIYYRNSAESTTDVRITRTGIPNVVYNGICDWVYEEEVFSATDVLWFSPDGKRMSFASFNDSATNTMPIIYYGEPASMYSQYPHLVNLHYPKPGVQNPSVSLSVVDLQEQTPTIKPLLLPNYKDPILSAVTWIDNDKLYATWMNRIQNKAEAFIYDVKKQTHNVIHTFEKIGGWLDLFKPPIFSADGETAIYIYAQDQNGTDRFYHVTLLNKTSQETFALTTGFFTVVDIISWDEANHVIYFSATVENHSEYQHIYQVPDTIVGAPHKSQCISCNTGSDHDECSFNSAVFSKNNSYFSLNCNGPNVPRSVLYDKNKKKLMVWEENEKLRNILKNVNAPRIKYLDVPLENSSLSARVKLLLPPNLDTSDGQKKYPLLINVYGGPGSNLAQDKFNIGWNSYLCSTKNVIVAQIDGRGSGLKGEEMLFSNYRKLGTYEIEDQISVTKYLQANFPYIDRKQIGIWGWSYGGYATGMVLVSDTDNLFKCGISVAPVVDWIYYDTIYTERYLGLPTSSDNLHGYMSSSLIRKSQRLKNKMYLLIHGTLDDNVHYQQSMLLARELELHDIPFQQQSYPDEEHSLIGVRHHFYHTLESFFSQCFMLKGV